MQWVKCELAEVLLYVTSSVTTVDMAAASALLPDIPGVQEDAPLHSFSFFPSFTHPGHSLCEGVCATSFSIMR